MKKSKRILSLIGAAAMALCFAACGPTDPSGNGGNGGTTPGGDTHTHTFEKDWTYDETNHWHAANCGHDGEQGSKAAHTFSETTEGTATCTEGVTIIRTCTTCGYTVTVKGDANGHTWEDVEEQMPTCIENGYTAHRRCTVCGATEGKQILWKTGRHFYDTENWAHDDRNHWHAAVCGCDRKIDSAAHTFSPEDNTCTTCGFLNPYAESDANMEKLFTMTQSNGKYTVTGLTEEGKQAAELTVAGLYKSKDVTAIADLAFEGATASKIVLSEGIVSIGHAAFLGCAATEISLPSTLKTIGECAFEDCASLQTFALPEGLTSLGYQAFAGCSALSAVTVPAGVTAIGDDTFLECTSLASVTLKGQVTSIGKEAFADCVKLTAIELPASLSFIGESAFRGSGLTEITVPDSVTAIGAKAFENCVDLVKATLGTGIKYFFGNLFGGCEKLAEVTVPFVGSNVTASASVTTAFGYYFSASAPKNADKFTKVTEDGKTFYVPNSLKTVHVLGGSIEEGAFDGCTMITEITASAGVTVNATAFDKCPATVKQG